MSAESFGDALELTSASWWMNTMQVFKTCVSNKKRKRAIFCRFAHLNSMNFLMKYILMKFVSFYVNILNGCWLDINTRTARGGGGFAPLPDFRNSSKTVADINAKLSAFYPPLIWRLPSKCQKKWKIIEKIACSWVVTLCWAILGKSGKCLKPSRM